MFGDHSILAGEPMQPGTSKSLPRNAKFGSRATSVPNVYDLANAVSAPDDQTDGEEEKTPEVNSENSCTYRSIDDQGKRMIVHTALTLLVLHCTTTNSISALILLVGVGLAEYFFLPCTK